MTTIHLGFAEFATEIRYEIEKGGEIVRGEFVGGYSEEYQMNTAMIIDTDRIAIGIDGNRMNEKTKWKIIEKVEGFDIEPFYSDEYIINMFI